MRSIIPFQFDSIQWILALPFPLIRIFFIFKACLFQHIAFFSPTTASSSSPFCFSEQPDQPKNIKYAAQNDQPRPTVQTKLPPAKAWHRFKKSGSRVITTPSPSSKVLHERAFHRGHAHDSGDRQQCRENLLSAVQNAPIMITTTLRATTVTSHHQHSSL